MAAVSICSDFGGPKKEVCHCFHCFPSVCHEVMGPDAIVFWMLSLKPTFSLSSFTFHQEAFQFFAFCHKGGVICMSEVIGISPGNLDSSLCFFQSSISHDVRASLVSQLVKNPPAMWETWVRSLVGKIPWRRERLPTPVFWPGEFPGLQSMGSQRVGHNWAIFTFTVHIS